MSNLNTTGYGPRMGEYRARRLEFDGDERKYELWEVKFMSHLRLQKLLKYVEGGLLDDPNDAEKNAEIFAELMQFLDDKSISLVIRDAKDDGREALKILREHYVGKSKPRVITLWTNLTTLKMSDDETVTDYIIRAETASTALRTADDYMNFLLECTL